MSMSDIDWGDAPTWIAAVFAGGAAWFAGMTLRSQRRQITEQQEFIREQSANLRLEREILRADADDRRRRQAQQVGMTVRLQGHGGGMQGPALEAWHVIVENRSAEPLHEVSVLCGGRIPATRAVGANSDREYGTPIPILGASTKVRFETDKFPQGEVGQEQPVLLFTDHSGARWRLDRFGDLSEAPQEGASVAQP
ncbi:hypothetical protein ACF09L_32680 [Streptomyces sp. NPDC014779]|uniref:hypothetical protein n=1 Tax=Streptomyces sp. NPDC014779 TaxID=3364911 RepID=UPI0037012E18